MPTPSPSVGAHEPAAGSAHVPGAIQPHGVLIALDEAQRVVVVSANIGSQLGLPAEEAIGAPLADVVGDDVAAAVGRRVAEGLPRDPPLVVELSGVVTGDLAGREVDVRVHTSGARTVVELEALAPSTGAAVSHRSARSAMASLARVGSVEDLTQKLADEVRALTDYDRVAVYRFDESWNGEVVAEQHRQGLDPFLGRHYPASDIPDRARRRYLVDPIRLIADVGRTPVPLHPGRDPATSQPLDLTHATLRSVSPTHVDHLSRLDARASMSIAIVIDDELWGLVVCHHCSGPHLPSQDTRSGAEFVTQVASHLIAHRERADAREAAVATQSQLTAMTARLTSGDGDVLDALFCDPSLLTTMGATGAAQLFDGILRTAGVVPSVEVMERIADALNQPDTYLSSTSHLAQLDPDFAAVADVAAGVLRVGTMADRWGMWFRPERRQVVDLQHVMRGHSRPWAPWEAEAADELGRRINSLLLLRSREQIAMAESMQRSVVLDHAPDLDGIEVVARYRPASSYQLGGDWWDAFELPTGRIAFVVGDVAGHGVAAASAMTQLRTALRAYLFEGHPPADGLDHLDRLMDGLLDVGIATAVVAVLDRGTGVVEIANAGHPLPLVVTEGDARQVPMRVRPLLGVGQGSSPSTYVDLAHGETMLLFTDGLVERRGADLDERTERLRQLAATRCPDESVDEWVDRLLVELGTTDDDTTLLAIRRRP